NNLSSDNFPTQATGIIDEIFDKVAYCVHTIDELCLVVRDRRVFFRGQRSCAVLMEVAATVLDAQPQKPKGCASISGNAPTSKRTLTSKHASTSSITSRRLRVSDMARPSPVVNLKIPASSVSDLLDVNVLPRSPCVAGFNCSARSP
ncbi:MAG: hypothetical protein J1F20_06705, partial [Muribaculaceae bacterium]|nr:hypothetical protein [Muribaculaceae bacterium]